MGNLFWKRSLSDCIVSAHSCIMVNEDPGRIKFFLHPGWPKMKTKSRNKRLRMLLESQPSFEETRDSKKKTFFVTALPIFHSRGLTMAFAWSSVIFLSLTMPVCVLGLDSEVFQNPYRCWGRHWKTSARKPRANILPIKMAFNRLGTERMSEVSCFRFWWSLMMRKWMGFVMVKQKTATFPVQ